jgi:nudix-type nucleoside diphosphatase (YffH/AdpP family)
MAELIARIGKPHSPYRFYDVRCARQGFLSTFVYRVSTVGHPIEMMDRGNAVVVLPADMSRREIVLIRQPRYNVAFAENPVVRGMLHGAPRARGRIGRLIEAIVLPFTAATHRAMEVTLPPEDVLCSEMPAGMIDADERPETAAVRELHEETGLRIDEDRLVKVAEYYPSIGGTTERLTAYIADVSGVAFDPAAHADDEESIEVWRYSFAEAFVMLRRGDFRSASMNILMRELELRLLRSGMAL